MGIIVKTCTLQCDAPKLTMKGKNMTEAQWDILRDAMHKVIAMQSNVVQPNCDQILVENPTKIQPKSEPILVENLVEKSSIKRCISSTFAGLMSGNKTLSEAQKAQMRQRFNTNDFLHFSPAQMKEAVRSWFNQAVDLVAQPPTNLVDQKEILVEKSVDLVENRSTKNENPTCIYNNINTSTDNIKNILNISSTKQPEIVSSELTNEKETVVVSSDSACEQKLPQPKRFVKPTLEEVATYCAEYCTGDRKKVDPAAFIDFYISKGWMVGKNPMKDWKAAVRNWERLSRNNGNNFNNNTNRYEKPKDIRFHTGISKKDWAGERARAEADNARRNPNYAAEEAERLRLLKNFSERLKPSTAA